MANDVRIPFNRPHMTGKELWYIAQAHQAANSPATARSRRSVTPGWSSARRRKKALLTHSCTAALEMAAMLAGLGPGDEVILPSFTFVSTANAFVLRGARRCSWTSAGHAQPRRALIEAAITPRTKAIVVVHYAGVGCEMDAIMATASATSCSSWRMPRTGCWRDYQGRALGSFGRWPRSASTKPRTSSPARAGRC